ncbi:ECF transporter S component [Nocardioides sp. WS12]|uniref:ECF transporter S component n=1 Tax=Nocardioides sp. WS12 TaxID=2486272 RepID=UPI0015F8D614|nr:ECF transporter S component [Nocardioides sp. WS12]
MSTDNSDRSVETGPFDAIAEDLKRLRTTAGMPSYNDIVVRIGLQRESRGLAPEVARPARTTVYDAFRPGRRRLDAALVGDIVRALGVPEHDVPGWEARVLEAHASAKAPTETAPEAGDIPSLPRPTRRWVAAVLVGCIALNLLGRVTVDNVLRPLDITLFLDMVGTAIAAIVLGPWWGVLVGITTNLGGAALSGWISIPFGIVNVGGALLWGYGVRRLGLGRTLPRFFVLNLLVALLCSALAAPIILMLGGTAQHATDDVIGTIRAVTHHLFASIFAGNLLASVEDKLLSGFMALVAAEVLGRPFLGKRPREV